MIVALMFCPNCGNELSDLEANFCPYCGYAQNEHVNDRLLCDQSTAPAVVKKKDGGLALIMSMFIPGIGQMYAGRIKRGICLLLIMLALGAMYLISLDTMWYSPGKTDVAILAILTINVLIWIYGMYDAYAIAKEHNSSLVRM